MSSIPTSDLAQGIEESATLALNARVKQMSAAGKTVYNLSAGEPDCPTPKYIQNYVAKHLDQNKYTPAAGLPELRQQIAYYAKDFYKLNWISSENVVVTASVKPGVWTALTCLINPGDEIILPVPTWVSYKHIIHLTGAKLVTTNLDKNFDLDIDDIVSKITSRTKAILLNSPQNPTGAIYSSAKLNRLAEILNEKDITVISDEIYSRLVFDDSYKPVCSHKFNHLIILDGFSKSQALTGWRIGFIIAEKSFARTCEKVLSHVMGNASVISQYAGLAVLTRGNQPVMLNQLKSNLALVCARLDGVPGVSYKKPAGAFYIFLDLRKITGDDLTWCENLLTAKGVSLVPGQAFDAPGFARLSFAGDPKILTKAIGLIAEFAGQNHA